MRREMLSDCVPQGHPSVRRYGREILFSSRGKEWLHGFTAARGMGEGYPNGIAHFDAFIPKSDNRKFSVAGPMSQTGEPIVVRVT
jgi:hypothetical protein